MTVGARVSVDSFQRRAVRLLTLEKEEGPLFYLSFWRSAFVANYLPILQIMII